MRWVYLLAGIAGLVSLIGCAGHRSLTIPDSETLTLHSAQSGQDHELIVILPSSYKTDPNRHYPTLYFLDAHWDFAMVYSLYEQMRLDNLIPELILVGLAYPGTNEDYIRRRMHDFTPVIDEKLPGSGGAPAFLGFLKETVVERIENSYRADPQQRALAGHSLGGLFTLYAMYQEPHFFERYLALSPSAITGAGYLVSKDSQYSKGNKNLPVRLFLSYGDDEYGPYISALEEFETNFSARNYSGLLYRREVLPTMRHATAKTHGYLSGLPWLYRDIAPSEPSILARTLKDVGL